MNDELKQQSNCFQTEICLLHNVFQANLPESDDFNHLNSTLNNPDVAENGKLLQNT